MFPAALLTMILSTRGHLFFSCTAEITPKSRNHMYIFWFSFIYYLFIGFVLFSFWKKGKHMKEKGKNPLSSLSHQSICRSSQNEGKVTAFLCAELPSHFLQRAKHREKLQGTEISVQSKIRMKGRKREHICPISQFLLPSSYHISCILLIL